MVKTSSMITWNIFYHSDQVGRESAESNYQAIDQFVSKSDKDYVRRYLWAKPAIQKIKKPKKKKQNRFLSKSYSL